MAPDEYPREALACVTTHDLPPLAGWWGAHDIAARQSIGMMTGEEAHAGAAGPRPYAPPPAWPVCPTTASCRRRWRRSCAPRRTRPTALPQSVAVALHRLMARTPSRLLVAQAEDLVGAVGQVNIPGTIDDHPNWKRKLPVDLEELAAHPLAGAIMTGAARGAAEACVDSRGKIRASHALTLRAPPAAIQCARRGWAPLGEYSMRGFVRAFACLLAFFPVLLLPALGRFAGAAAPRHRRRRLFRLRLRRPEGRRSRRLQERLPGRRSVPSLHLQRLGALVLPEKRRRRPARRRGCRLRPHRRLRRAGARCGSGAHRRAQLPAAILCRRGPPAGRPDQSGATDRASG